MAKILAMVFLVLVYVSFGQVVTKTENKDSDKLVGVVPFAPKKDCVTIDFHYLIIENEQRTSTVRHIEVFLDEKAFSEENLKTLFTYLSNKHPETKILVVVVKTNWRQLPLPSDCPGIGRSNQPARPDEYDYHQATYYRNEKIEYFRYNPILKTEDFKEIILKGKKL